MSTETPNRENVVCIACSPDGTMALIPCGHVVCYSCVMAMYLYNSGRSGCPVCGEKLRFYSLGAKLTDDQSVERNAHEIFFFPQPQRVSFTRLLKAGHDPLYFAPSTKDRQVTRVTPRSRLSLSDLYDFELRQIKSENC